MKPLVFLSHAAEDLAAARIVAAQLREAGLNVWLDVEELLPGDLWMSAVENALVRADMFAVYIGRSGIRRWVDPEVRVALERNVRDPKFRIIPIIGPGADAKMLPPFLLQHQWIDARESSPALAFQKLLARTITLRTRGKDFTCDVHDRCCLSGDSREAVTASADGTARIFPTTLTGLLLLAEARLSEAKAAEV